MTSELAQQPRLLRRREQCAAKDISIGGSANIVQQYLKAGVIDEIRLHLVPVLIGGGIRLFAEDAVPSQRWFATTSVVESGGVIHMRYSTPAS